MEIRSLGYLEVHVADLEAWTAFAGRLGLVVSGPEDGTRELRLDEWPYRVQLRPTGASEGIGCVGWQVADEAALEVAATGLAAAGHPVERGAPEELAARRVRGLVRTVDPAGVPVEVFWGPVLDHALFVSPAGVSGFVTGDMGMGHVVFGVPDVATTAAFYTDVMGFRVSDIWRPGADDVVFLRCNPRHHSLALVPAAETTLYHFMVEAATLDDVGYALDRVVDAGDPIRMGLGRHTNDRMVSFYVTTPSGFDVEFGTGGIRVDEETWITAEITRPSFWGHKPPG